MSTQTRAFSQMEGAFLLKMTIDMQVNKCSPRNFFDRGGVGNENYFVEL
jgi:hypothetical protein